MNFPHLFFQTKEKNNTGFPKYTLYHQPNKKQTNSPFIQWSRKKQQGLASVFQPTHPPAKPELTHHPSGLRLASGKLGNLMFFHGSTLDVEIRRTFRFRFLLQAERDIAQQI